MDSWKLIKNINEYNLKNIGIGRVTSFTENKNRINITNITIPIRIQPKIPIFARVILNNEDIIHAPRPKIPS